MAIITFFETQKGDRPFYNKHLSGHKLHYSEEVLTAGLAAEFRETEILSVFVHSHVTKEVLSKLPKLRLIATRSAGFNQIDLAAAEGTFLSVTSLPGEYGVEHTLP